VPTSVRIRQFWTWFQAHDAVLFAVRTAQEPVCDTLSWMLQAVDSNLTFEFGPLDHGRRDFVVSADGVISAFAAVEAIGNTAPFMDRWHIVKFRPRREPMPLVVGPLAIDPKDVGVQLSADGDKVALVVSLPGYRRLADRRFERTGYLILDQALGEYTMETRIGAIDFVPTEQRRPGTWRSLRELPALVDNWRR